MKPYWENKAIDSSKTINLQKILLPGEDICPEDHDACIQKINDRLGFANYITAISHTIEHGSGGEVVGVINFPAFSNGSPEEKEQIIKEIKQSNAKVFAIGIASKHEDFSENIKVLLKEIPFEELHIRLYDEPDNLIEIFDTITWKKNEKMKLTLEFINLDLPEYLRLFDYIYMSEKMIQRNNGNIPLASFSLIFNPLFYEFKRIYHCLLYPEDGRILKNISAKELHIKGIGTEYTNGIYGRYEDEKGRIHNFLDTSPIMNIFLDSIAKKENGIITLYGF